MDVLDRLAERTKERREVRKLNNLLGPHAGSVWLTKPDPSSDRAYGPMVLIRNRSERPDVIVLSVAEISKDIFHALNDDLILERQLTDLPFRCMVRTSNLFPTTPSDLLTCLSEFDDTLMYIINRMAGCYINHMSIEEAIGLGIGVLSVEPRTLTPLLNYANLVRTGLPCTSENDPRLRHLRQAYHERTYLSRGAKQNFQW